MADQILSYANQTTDAAYAVKFIRHCQDYGLLTEADMNLLTTYAGLRAVIAAHVVPGIGFEAENIQRQAIGDGSGRPGVLGRANLDGALTDAMITDAGDESSGARIDKLCTLINVNVTPDLILSTSRDTFALQV